MWNYVNSQIVNEDGVLWKDFVTENLTKYKFFVLYQPDSNVVLEVRAKFKGKLNPIGNEVALMNEIPDGYNAKYIYTYDKTTNTFSLDLDLNKARYLKKLDGLYKNTDKVLVDYTSVAGVKGTYQADKVSITAISNDFNIYSVIGNVPAGYYWVDYDNNKVPFTLTDLKQLLIAAKDVNWDRFNMIQAAKQQVRSATTLSDVQKFVDYMSVSAIS